MSSNSTPTTPRVTVAALAQIVAQQGAIMAQQGEQIGQILALLTAPATPATVVTAITDAPSVRTTATPKAKAPKARKGGKATACKSFAEGEALAATGVSPDAITVPKGKFGRDGVQTLTDARVKRAEAEAKREAYLAERANGTTTAKATTPKPAPTPKATANPYFAMSKDALVADGSEGAQAELARRAAKRALKA